MEGVRNEDKRIISKGFTCKIMIILVVRIYFNILYMSNKKIKHKVDNKKGIK